LFIFQLPAMIGYAHEDSFSKTAAGTRQLAPD